jgi:hypothetical protein
MTVLPWVLKEFHKIYQRWVTWGLPQPTMTIRSLTKSHLLKILLIPVSSTIRTKI